MASMPAALDDESFQYIVLSILCDESSLLVCYFGAWLFSPRVDSVDL